MEPRCRDWTWAEEILGWLVGEAAGFLLLFLQSALLRGELGKRIDTRLWLDYESGMGTSRYPVECQHIGSYLAIEMRVLK